MFDILSEKSIHSFRLSFNEQKKKYTKEKFDKIRSVKLTFQSNDETSIFIF
jgi:hypothetical protein